MTAVPEIRIDQLTGLRTILAPGRAGRPDAFTPVPAESKPDAAASCPFCEGRESRTPPEVWADRPDGAGGADSPGWAVRSVPNMYPALVPADNGSGGASAPVPLAGGRDEADMFNPIAAEGAHEVIVSCPWHATSLADLDEAGLRRAMDGWATRMAAHETAGAAYVHLIVNEGPLAGASLEHSHAQLYVLGFVPAAVARERERAAAYHQRTMGGNLLGDVLAEEVRRRERFIDMDDHAALICPWASHSPFEMRILPRKPQASFSETGGVVAPMLATALAALAGAVSGLPQFNLWIRNAPRGATGPDAGFSWHIDIRPRLTVQAGLELGAGVDLCSYAPETAAADLRAASR